MVPSALIVFDAAGSMWGKVKGKAKIEIARVVVADLAITSRFWRKKDLMVAM